MPPKSKVRRLRQRTEAKQILEDLIEGKGDIFVAYGRLFKLWNGNDAVLKELRPLFRIPSVDACGSFEFRAQVLSSASAILPLFQSVPPSSQSQKRGK